MASTPLLYSTTPAPAPAHHIYTHKFIPPSTSARLTLSSPPDEGDETPYGSPAVHYPRKSIASPRRPRPGDA
ncbi:hypothetical protein B0H10DRAFT_2207171 [Mycena sp. CBHHK59/15]|nr:hypothetical protein B0H10DRAFT_2207171 [Mycena sp. CBHHK59/15]